MKNKVKNSSNCIYTAVRQEGHTDKTKLLAEGKCQFTKHSGEKNPRKSSMKKPRTHWTWKTDDLDLNLSPITYWPSNQRQVS